MIDSISVILSTYTNNSNLNCITFKNNEFGNKSDSLFNELYWIFNNKIVVGVPDPKFQLITNGLISGEQIIGEHFKVIGFRNYQYLTIKPANGINRQIRLIPYHNIGYTLDVEGSISIGLKPAYLSQHEIDFYKSIFITTYEPTYSNLMSELEKLVNNVERNT